MTEELPSIRDAISELAAARGISELDALRWVAGAAESAAIAARRERELRPHRVAHEVTEVAVEVETWQPGHKDNTREPRFTKDGAPEAPGRRKVIEHRVSMTDCPDCGRPLVSAADVDIPATLHQVFVCPRIHGYAVSGKLADGDIVACGLEG